ncbi:MAG: hypothetical protein JO150_07530, partial [Acidobacteriaceae bacterium]|nr:hypothetical protein [Acidobacteriaceae bacterium]
MRSVAEITFRARQEAASLYLLASQPSFHGTVSRKLKLPNPQDVVDALRGSAYAQSVEKIANQLIAHRFPIFGQEIQ